MPPVHTIPRAEERLAIAVAVADPRERAQRLRLDGRKKVSDGFVAIDQAVRTSSPFMVKARPGLLVLDGDTDSSSRWVQDWAVDFLADLALMPVVMLSGQPADQEPRVHLFAANALGVVPDHFLSAAQENGVDVRSGDWIRPPYSPHPLGGCSTPLHSTTTPAGILRALGGDTPALARLTPGALSMLITADTDGRFVGQDGTLDRSRMLLSLAHEFTSARLSFEDFEDALLDPRHRAGERYREHFVRSQRTARAWLERTWAKATASHFRGRDDALAYMEEMQAAKAEAEAVGALRSTLSVVLDAHIALATDLGGPSYFLAVRDIGVEAGVSTATASRSTNRLVELGWIIKTTKPGPGKATGFRLTIPSRGCNTITSHPPNEMSVLHVRDENSEIDQGHDAFRYGALGKTGLRILRALDSGGPMTKVEIFKVLGTPQESQIWRTLAKTLEPHGLVVRSGKKGDVWAVAPGWRDRLEVVAEEMGVSGKGDWQVAAVERDRALYREAITRVDEARSPLAEIYGVRLPGGSTQVGLGLTEAEANVLADRVDGEVVVFLPAA
jgi:hypothetical protein